MICAVQIVELPKSGRVLAADYFSPEDPYILYARFFSDGNTWLTVREWPAQNWTKQQPVSWQRTWQFGPADVWSPKDDAELALSFLPPILLGSILYQSVLRILEKLTIIML